MKQVIFSAAILLAGTGAALANIPFFNATCGAGVDVHADQGGPVYINGKETKLTKHSANSYTATHGHHTIDFSKNPDGSILATYTGKGGVNGICVVNGDGGEDDYCPPDVSEANRYLYPACN